MMLQIYCYNMISMIVLLILSAPTCSMSTHTEEELSFYDTQSAKKVSNATDLPVLLQNKVCWSSTTMCPCFGAKYDFLNSNFWILYPSNLTKILQTGWKNPKEFKVEFWRQFWWIFERGNVPKNSNLHFGANLSFPRRSVAFGPNDSSTRACSATNSRSPDLNNVSSGALVSSTSRWRSCTGSLQCCACIDSYYHRIACSHASRVACAHQGWIHIGFVPRCAMIDLFSKGIFGVPC